MGRSLKYKKEPHNRLLMAFAHAFGHDLKDFPVTQAGAARGADGWRV